MMLSREDLTVALGRIGLPGFLALALVAWSAWQWAAVTPAIVAATGDLQRQVREERARKTAPPHDTSGLSPLGLLRARLPPERGANALLAASLDRARTLELVIESVQFRSVSTALPGVLRHQATLPLRGTYESVRSWISQTLNQDTWITLDALDIERHNASAAQVEATLTISLWANATTPPASSPDTGGARAR